MGLIGFTLIRLFVNGLVSFGFASSLRSTGFAIVGSAIVTVMLFLVWAANAAANATTEDLHDVALAVNITLMFMIPTAFVTSSGFVLLTKREQRNNAAPPMDSASSGHAEGVKTGPTKP